MSYSESLAQAVRQVLFEQLPLKEFEEDVQEVKMFGGLAFMLRGKMCVCVNETTVMVRIGKEKHQSLALPQGASTTVMKGRTYKGYVDLDSKAQGQESLVYWIRLALEYNGELLD